MMVLKKEEETFNKCLIKIPTNKVVDDTNDSLDSTENKDNVLQEDMEQHNIEVKDVKSSTEQSIEQSTEQSTELSKIELSELNSNDTSSIHSSENSLNDDNEDNNIVTEVTGSIVEDRSFKLGYKKGYLSLSNSFASSSSFLRKSLFEVLVALGSLSIEVLSKETSGDKVSSSSSITPLLGFLVTNLSFLVFFLLIAVDISYILLI